MPNQIKVGVLAFPQYTDWPSLQRIGQRVDELGYDSLWTWDHLYPIQGDWRGPIFEGYMTLAGWASVTKRVSVGLMVGANPFRNPALVAKMVTQLDHMTDGRAVLGIGGAWFEREHRAYGFEFGHSPGERLGWLDEAVPVMWAMLRGEGATASGPRYQVRDVRNDPPPIQANVPILTRSTSWGRSVVSPAPQTNRGRSTTVSKPGRFAARTTCSARALVAE